MKILHIIPSYLPAKLASGPIKPTHALNKELVKKGVEVVVYTTNLDGQEILDVPLNREIDIEGVKVFYFPITFKPWQYSYSLHRVLAKNIKNFDLIHMTSIFLSVSTLGAYYAKKFKKPYIISPHGSLMQEPLRRHSIKKKIYLSLIEKRNLTNASAIHFVTDKEKNDYLATGFFLKKAVIIPNAINFNEFKNQPSVGYFRDKFKISSGGKIILFLARLHPIKGLDTLIPAFAEVIRKEPTAVLILAGPDEEGYKRNVQLLIANYQLQDKVIFTDMLTGNDKTAAFKESDVFVLPSYSEALSIATLEAMFFNLPIIITKNSGLAEIVVDVGAGIVIEKDEKQLTEAILKILNNPELAKKMGENGRKLVETEFSSEKVAEKWIEEYRNLIKNIN